MKIARGLPSSPFCLWIVALSGAGKSALTRALFAQLRQYGNHAVAVTELTFVAGLTVICAFILSFAADHVVARSRFSAGRFLEIYPSAALAKCALRDPKGSYAKARAGTISGLTGLDAPYEAPTAPGFSFDTRVLAIAMIVAQLLARRYPR